MVEVAKDLRLHLTVQFSFLHLLFLIVERASRAHGWDNPD
jgi:hypothetical protein